MRGVDPQKNETALDAATRLSTEAAHKGPYLDQQKNAILTYENLYLLRDGCNPYQVLTAFRKGGLVDTLHLCSWTALTIVVLLPLILIPENTLAKAAVVIGVVLIAASLVFYLISVKQLVRDEITVKIRTSPSENRFLYFLDDEQKGLLEDVAETQAASVVQGTLDLVVMSIQQKTEKKERVWREAAEQNPSLNTGSPG